VQSAIRLIEARADEGESIGNLPRLARESDSTIAAPRQYGHPQLSDDI
jgi:hypothetical protein